MDYKDINITKYPQSGFRIDYKNGHIYIDPFRLPEDQPKATLIFISHEHFDHLDRESIMSVSTVDTIIVGNKLVHSALTSSENFIEVAPCDSGTIKDIKFTCIAAYNINKFKSPGAYFHPKENNGIGFVIDIFAKEKVRIFHMGDTDFVVGEHSIPNVDILLIPVSGTYVMTKEEAAEAANTIRPKIAIPIHFDAGIVGSLKDAKYFQDNAHVQVKLL